MLLVCLFSFGASAGDTTYSHTRSVPKAESGSESGSGGLPSLFRLLGEVISSGVTAECGTCAAPAPPAPEMPADMREWPEGGWRWGLGYGAGGLRIADQGSGAQGHVAGEATFEFPGGLQLRLEGGGFAGLVEPDVDYRRDVYVDGRFIGRQYDTTLLFARSGYSLFSDMLTLLGSSGAYVGAGVGAIRLRESAELARHEDFDPSPQARAEARWQWLPAVRVAWGLYAGGHRQGPFWRFEVGYQASFHSPRYVSSLPTDNSPVTHSLSMGFAWL